MDEGGRRTEKTDGRRGEAEGKEEWGREGKDEDEKEEKDDSDFGIQDDGDDINNDDGAVVVGSGSKAPGDATAGSGGGGDDALAKMERTMHILRQNGVLCTAGPDDCIAALGGTLRIRGPDYGPRGCVSTNPLILRRVRKLLASQPWS